MHNFVLNRTYTRPQIHEQLGGEVESFLPRVKGNVVCACIDPKRNPDAPMKILVGNVPSIRAAAQQLSAKTHFEIPVFLKRDPKKWEYVGDYRVDRCLDDYASLQREITRSGRPDITMVLHLRCSRTENSLVPTEAFKTVEEVIS